MKEVEGLNEKLLDEKTFAEYVRTFKSDEPYIYSWMGTHAKSILSFLSHKGVNDSTLLTNIYENICRSYMFTYSLFAKNRELLVDNLLERDHYQSFLDGKLSDRHYQYSTEGLASDSELVRAKEAYHRRCLQDIRKSLIPLIAEDVGIGYTIPETLNKIESIGKA